MKDISILSHLCISRHENDLYLKVAVSWDAFRGCTGYETSERWVDHRHSSKILYLFR